MLKNSWVYCKNKYFICSIPINFHITEVCICPVVPIIVAPSVSSVTHVFFVCCLYNLKYLNSTYMKGSLCARHQSTSECTEDETTNATESVIIMSHESTTAISSTTT